MDSVVRKQTNKQKKKTKKRSGASWAFQLTNTRVSKGCLGLPPVEHPMRQFCSVVAQWLPSASETDFLRHIV